MDIKVFFKSWLYGRCENILKLVIVFPPSNSGGNPK